MSLLDEAVKNVLDKALAGRPLPTLTKGKALVITGAQGSGKGIVSHQVAANFGAQKRNVAFLKFSDLVHYENCREKKKERVSHFTRFGFYPLYQGEISVVIIDCVPPGSDLSEFKQCITSTEIEVDVKGSPRRMVPAPQFIFISQEFTPGDDSRRFEVFHIGEGA